MTLKLKQQKTQECHTNNNAKVGKSSQNSKSITQNNDQNITSITQATKTREKLNLSVAQITTSKLEQGTMTQAVMLL